MKKRSFITLAIVFLLALGLVQGYNRLSQHIYNSMDCEGSNIDHIELRTGLNIPAVSNAVCEFDELQQKRISKFTLALAPADIDKYLSTNHFEQQEESYIRSGNGESHSWEAKIDPEAKLLTVEIDYRR